MVMVLVLTGCQILNKSDNPEWQRIEDSAKGSTVNFYIWTDDEEAYTWFNTTVKEGLKTNFDITLNLIEVEPDEALNLLMDDQVKEETLGQIDVLWLDEKAFETYQAKGLLYEGFAQKLDHYQRFMSTKDLDNLYMSHVPIKGQAVAFNSSQLTLYYNEDIIYDPPMTLEDLMSIAKVNEGMVTYPEPTDEVGGAFVRSIILNFVDAKKFVEEDLDSEAFRLLVQPAFDYLKALKPYLYEKGTRYPKNQEELARLFGDEALILTYSMDFRHANTMTGDAIYPGGTKPFIMGSASVGTKEYLTMPFNASNKAGAMVLMNYLLDIDVQAKKLADRKYNGIPVVNLDLLDATSRTQIEKAIRKKTIVTITDLMDNRQHDIPKKYHDLIDQIWYEQIMSE